jgi:hypothetical protein
MPQRNLNHFDFIYQLSVSPLRIRACSDEAFHRTGRLFPRVEGGSLAYIQESSMSLSSSNQSRNYEKARKRIRFIGHGWMFEIPFSAGANLFPVTASEAGYLNAFDGAWVAIFEAARRAYSGARRPGYVLTRDDIG